MVAFSVLFMDFIQFLTSIQILKLSLGFGVGKFRDNDVLKIVYGFIFSKFKLK